MSDAIAFDRVSAGYRGRVVLSGWTLSIAAGEMFGVLGPNACGKTTMLRVASGVLGPSAGRVLLFGRDIATSTPRDVARRVAVVPQSTVPVFGMASLEVVLLGRHPWHPAFAFETGEDVAVAQAALADVDAAHLADRDFATLSGGERQRVLIARALCQGADVLLCDEPTAHLDLKHQTSTFRLLRSLASSGRTVVVVTHDVELAAQACDRIALLAPAALVATGTPDAVITRENLAAAFAIDTHIHRDARGRPLVVRQLDLGEERT